MPENRTLEISSIASDGTKQTYTLIVFEAPQLGAAVRKAEATAAKSLEHVGTRAKTAGTAVASAGLTSRLTVESVRPFQPRPT